jgi:uncharacterized membrane protein (DUF485 family)
LSREVEAMSEPAALLRDLSARRFRLALVLTSAVIAVYFGFISLVAFDKEQLATPVTSGLSLGILLGALVIVFSWLTTWYYVRWMNRNYDDALARLKD